MRKKCNHYGCVNGVVAKGLCNYHYQRLKQRKYTQRAELLCACGSVAFALGKCHECYESFFEEHAPHRGRPVDVKRRRSELKSQIERANVAAEYAVSRAEAQAKDLPKQIERANAAADYVVAKAKAQAEDLPKQIERANAAVEQAIAKAKALAEDLPKQIERANAAAEQAVADLERRRRELKDQAERANAAAEEAVAKAEALTKSLTEELLALDAPVTEDVDWGSLKVEHGRAENRTRSVRWAREQVGRGGGEGMCQAHDCKKRAVSDGLCRDHHEKWELNLDITSLECCGHEGCSRPLFGNGLCVHHFKAASRADLTAS